jgi:hypothetical protein
MSTKAFWIHVFHAVPFLFDVFNVESLQQLMKMPTNAPAKCTLLSTSFLFRFFCATCVRACLPFAPYPDSCFVTLLVHHHLADLKLGTELVLNLGFTLAGLVAPSLVPWCVQLSESNHLYLS